MKRLGKYDPKNKSLLRGYVKIRDERKSFCIDSADAPFLFSSKDLRERYISRYSALKNLVKRAFIWVMYVFLGLIMIM